MNTFKLFIFAVAIIFIAGNASAQNLSPKEALGKAIFFDENLSTPTGQSCASCHGPETGYTGPHSDINATTVVYPGAITTRFGNRKPPTAAYGGKSPIMYKTKKNDLFIGGMFWDGRATGWELGDPLAEQARGPFLNPVEQNIATKAEVIDKIRNASYAPLFETVYGSIWGNIDEAYDKVAFAIAAYERSAEVNPFTSKFDYYLKGKVKLTKQEKDGLRYFNTYGKCAKCHISKPHDKNTPPLFTDFTYDNLGLPKNPDNPFYTQSPDINPDSTAWIDKGLGGFLETVPQYSVYAAANYGKHRVPTLRNVDKRPYEGFVKSYGHNGFFKSLKDIIHFYNTRDVKTTWPPPEVPMNVNTAELGNLRLSHEDEDAIVAFLKTLSDGYVLPLARNGIAAGSPTNFALIQNTPNPFNPSTLISYELPTAGYVTLKVYNLLGQEIATLVDGVQEPGYESVMFDANNLPSGMYFARLVADGLTQTHKMLLLR